ncbi:MAG: 16S rRNA (uracil(1498)-N(3))-methyltransferase [Patescibacteria group bacterium]
MPNVFVTPDQIRGDTLRVTGGDAHHLARVLRLGTGDFFTALDGAGIEYRAVVVAVDRDGVLARIEEKSARQTEPRLRLTLGQALPKGDKMDEVVRKCTELGLAEFWPLLAERCVSVPDESRLPGRVERWQKIAAEAARQSGRAVVPQVAAPRKWDEAAAACGLFDLALLAWEGESATSLRRALEDSPHPTKILVLIGPEGGFSQTEAKAAAEGGAVPVTLGPRILRTETAGLVAAAAIFYHYGELAMGQA